MKTKYYLCTPKGFQSFMRRQKEFLIHANILGSENKELMIQKIGLLSDIIRAVVEEFGIKKGFSILYLALDEIRVLDIDGDIISLEHYVNREKYRISKALGHDICPSYDEMREYLGNKVQYMIDLYVRKHQEVISADIA